MVRPAYKRTYIKSKDSIRDDIGFRKDTGSLYAHQTQTSRHWNNVPEVGVQ